MLPRQKNFNARRQQSSRNQGGKYGPDSSPNKSKKKSMGRQDDHQKKLKPNSGKGNYSRMNSGEDPDQDVRGNGRSMGKGNRDRKKSFEKKGSRNNLMKRKKSSKSSLSQNKRSRGASQKNKKNKQNNQYNVLSIQACLRLV